LTKSEFRGKIWIERSAKESASCWPLFFSFKGDGRMFKIFVRKTFSAAHKLPYPEKCRRLHGHTWTVEVVLAKEELNEHGFVRDFAEVKEALEEILPDHSYLNERFDFLTTAEGLERHFYRRLKPLFPELLSVSVFESENCGALYSG